MGTPSLRGPGRALLTRSPLPQDCAGVILYSAECATQVALDGIQCFGEWPPLPAAVLPLTAAEPAPLGFCPSH